MTASASSLLSLLEAQEQAWAHATQPPETLEAALETLQQSAQQALQAYQANRWVEAQEGLEQSLIELLLALKKWDLNAEASFFRAVSRQAQQERAARVFKVFQDRVELWVGEDYRGGWPLLSDEDYKACCRLAEEMGCELQTQDPHTQLDLFSQSSHPTSQV